ncbi:efflux RND transporter periplasmic adaptor subunit [Pseudomonas syringae]|nr:efflux RND transporter periplasmic adaptor subunit [Pseudomonas syringae]
MLFLQKTEAAQPAIDAPMAMTVTEASARMTEWPVHLNASGAITPWQEAVIGGQVSGVRLTELLVGPGDFVHRGQVLARYETEALRADVAQLHAALRQAKAQAAQAIAKRDRALKLKEIGAMSEQDIHQSVTEAEAASAQVESSQAQLASGMLQIKYATVVSPDDGVISARSATIGAVGAVGEELFRLIRHNRLEWRGELTAAQLGQSSAGQNVTLGLPDGLVAQARIRQIAPLLESTTRLATVYADITPGSTARAGMYAQGSIAVTQKSALIVPASSVIIRDGRSQVFTLDTQEDVAKASLKSVKVGRRQAHDVEILEGLSEGDRVLVQGAGFVNDGDRVRVVQTPPVVTPATVVTQRSSQ